MEALSKAAMRLREWLEISLLTFGGTPLTLWSLLTTVLLILVIFYAAGLLRTWLTVLLRRSGLAPGVGQAVGALVRYTVIFLGLVVVLQTAGINLTALTVLAGAVGIGVGFGLQNIISNFISGLIILFERPIKIGDRIEVGAVEGDVVAIGARATTVVTNDEIAIIIPNSKFITENVVNWSHAGERVRFKIPVQVAYASDVRLVERLLLEVAAENPDVLSDPPPGVRFLAFGDSGLDFELRAWSSSLLHRRGRLTSALNFAIHEKFKAHGVEIPYPTRDLRLRGGPIEVRTRPADA